MNKIINLIKNSFTTIKVTEVTTNNHVYCDNKILPDLTNIIAFDRAGNSYNSFTRLQPNTNLTQFINKLTNTPISDVVTIEFYPFKELAQVYQLDTLDKLDVDLGNSTNGIVNYGLFEMNSKYFVRVTITTYIKHGLQDMQTHANIVFNLEYYIRKTLRKICISQETKQRVLNETLTLIESTLITQIM